MSTHKETLDVVDDQDKVVGSIDRQNTASLGDTPGRYIRAAELFIQRPDGRIFLPRRSPHKKIAPGGLDLSAAGHINQGETYEQAAIRETEEETGIIASPEDLVLIKKIGPTAIFFYFRMLYLLRTDQEPKLSSEHTEAVWLPPEQLLDFVQNDVPTKEALYEDIPLLLDYLKAKDELLAN